MNRIREIRKARGLKLKEVGSLIGVSESTVSMYENSKREPDIATLIKLADLLDVSLDYLLCRVDHCDWAVKKEKELIANDDELTRRGVILLSQLSDQNTQRALDFAQGLLTAQETLLSQK